MSKRRWVIWGAFALLAVLGSTARADLANCPADISGDGKVGPSDLSVLLLNFGLTEAEYADGDLDIDGAVGLSDLVLLLQDFGLECEPPLPCPGDMNRNHQIDISDLAILLANFGLRPARAQDGDLDGDHVVGLSDLVLLNMQLNLPCEPVLADCQTSTSTWQNNAFFAQTGLFALSFDVVPSSNNIDALTTLSSVPVAGYTDLAAGVRFNVDGFLDVRDGSSYRADLPVPYEGGEVYSFRLVVDVAQHRYTVFVTTPSNGEVRLANNYRFRTEQLDVGNLQYWSTQAGIGAHDTCNLELLSSDNLPPVVSAGVDLETPQPTVTLAGSASDDGRPDGTLLIDWEQISGPGAAVFADRTNPTTQVTLPIEGTYVFELMASDGEEFDSDRVTVVRTAPPPPQLTVTPSLLDIPLGSSTGTISVGMIGVGALEYNVTESADWLDVSPTTGSTSGEVDDLTVSIDRTGLSDGVYQAEIQIVGSSGAPVQSTVRIFVGATIPSNSAERSVGVAPFGVFFDATQPDSGVQQPPLVNGRREYADLVYIWDFGDDGGETWSTSGKSRNTATGYCAAHVYEQPGTYTVTLLVIDPVTEASTVYSETIEVLPFTGTTYYVSTSGLNSNDGTSPSAPLQTISEALSRSSDSTRILLKRGDTWTVPGGVRVRDAGPGIIGAYANADGSDDRSQPKPRIRVTNGGAHGVEFIGWSLDVSDWRLMDLELIGPGGAGAGDGVRGNGTLRQATLLRLTLRDFYVGVLWSYWSADHADNIVADCYLTGMHHNDVYVGGERHAFLGNVMDPPTNEHVLRVWHMKRGVYAHNDFGPAPRHQIKLHNDVAAPTTGATQYNIFTDNVFTGNSAWSVTIGPQDEFSNEVVSDTLLERNTFRSVEGRVQRALALWTRYSTVRNNLFFADGSAIWYEAISVTQRAGEGGPRGNRILNNTCVRLENSNEFTFCRIGGSASDTEVWNNLIVPGNANEIYPVSDGSGAAAIGNNLVTNAGGFVNAAGGDLRLTEQSAAIDAARDIRLLFDFVGNGRFDDIRSDTGSGSVSYADIGAFEYQGN